MWCGNLVMTILLMKQDKPTNYKEAMVNPSPRNGYEPYIILDKIHVWLPSGDLGKLSRWPLGRWEQMEFYEKNRYWRNGSRPIKFDLSRNGFDKFKELTTTRLCFWWRSLSLFRIVLAVTTISNWEIDRWINRVPDGNIKEELYTLFLSDTPVLHLYVLSV